MRWSNEHIEQTANGNMSLTGDKGLQQINHSRWNPGLRPNFMKRSLLTQRAILLAEPTIELQLASADSNSP